MTENNTNEETIETQTEQPDNPNAEAKKWRLKLRDAETERDNLQQQLTQARREIVANALEKDRRLDPAAMDDAGINIDELFEDGALNHDSLTQQLTTAKEQKPYLFNNGKLFVPAEGGTPTITPGGNSWQDAFAPRNS